MGGRMPEFAKFREDTRRPQEKPPPGSCDCQAHVCGPIDRYPARPGASYVPDADANAEAAERMHKALGLERGVFVQATVYGTDNRVLLDALANRPNYRGIILMDEAITDRELQRMHEAGVRGARFNFWKRLNLVPDPAAFERSVARIREFGWHARIHAVGPEWLELKELLLKAKITIVVDHMGHPDLRGGIDQPATRMLRDLVQRGNWWVMISNPDRFSASPEIWNDVLPFARSFIEAAPDRAVWATDWPHVMHQGRMPDDAELIEFLYRAAPEAELRRKVLSDNPARLHGFYG
jgi:2-pyrone-4,6-dicarboxylate lactonase